ncbi:MAG: PAS domain S-box protein [Calditrichaeota bacterium]|nr:MAG: PAS domain S-box protein [Calditrichota bacterium]
MRNRSNKTLMNEPNLTKITEISYQKLLNSLPQKIFIKDLNSNYIFCNENYAKDLGMKPELIIGKNDFGFYDKKLAKKYRNEDKRIISSGKAEDFVEKNIIDGNEYFVHTLKSVIKDDKGNVEGILGIFWDVTNELENRELIDNQQKFLESIFQGVSLPIFVIDVENNGTLKFNSINPAHEKLSGMTNDWIKGKSTKDLEEFITKAGVEHIEQRYNSCLEASEPIYYQEMIPMNGKETWWNTTLTPLKNKDGIIYRIIGTASFINEKITLEEEVKKYKEDLETLFKKRTQEIEKTNQALLKKISERKKIEKELRKNQVELKMNQLKLKLSIDASKIGIWDWNMEENSLSWDERMCQMFDLELNDVQNYENFISRVHQEDKERVNAEVAKAAETGIDFDTNYRIVWRNGTIKHIVAKGNFYYNKAGVPIRMNGICLDDTERFEAENKLKQEKERAQHYLDVAGNMFIVINKNQNVTLINQSGLKILEYENENEIIGKNWFENFLPKENIEEAKETFNSLINEKIELVDSFENDLVTKSGKLKTIAWHNSLIRNSEDEIIEIISNGEDITEKKKTAKERDLFFNLSLSFMAVANLDGFFKLLNPTWEKTLGYTLKELKSKPYIEFVHPEDVEITLKEIENLNKGIKAINFTNRYQTKDGSYRWLNWNAVPFGDLFYCSATDVTELKSNTLLLENLNKKLKSSNSELEQFAYVASHDLQEPLRKISSFLNIIENRYKDKLDEKGKQYIDFTVKGAERMKVLINNLLEFSRISTRGKEFLLVDSSEILNLTLETFSNTIEEKNAKISIQKNFPKINVDSTQIEILFQNLIGNALKFCDKNNPDISLKFKRKANFWNFSVIDNGIGIKNDYKDRVFIIFQRLHTREEYPGTGIGLAVCKKIVERHGGEIWFESEVGKGTTFHFTIPILSKN